jgi:hypothetical protein
MLHGENPDWQRFLTSLERSAAEAAPRVAAMQPESRSPTSSSSLQGTLNLIEDDEGDTSLNALRQETRIRAAMDSGSCRNVTHPKTLPSGVKVTPNTSGKHFSGAGGEVIEKFGECMTTLEGPHGQVGCRWNVADVTRPLHSVSQIAGPYDGTGNQDVLFNNKRCVVVAPGVVEAIMKQISPVAEYHRDGNLYLSDFTMSDFVRQGQDE